MLTRLNTESYAPDMIVSLLLATMSSYQFSICNDVRTRLSAMPVIHNHGVDTNSPAEFASVARHVIVCLNNSFHCAPSTLSDGIFAVAKCLPYLICVVNVRCDNDVKRNALRRKIDVI